MGALMSYYLKDPEFPFGMMRKFLTWKVNVLNTTGYYTLKWLKQYIFYIYLIQ